jgi:hypothetical protein
MPTMPMTMPTSSAATASRLIVVVGIIMGMVGKKPVTSGDHGTSYQFA